MIPFVKVTGAINIYVDGEMKTISKDAAHYEDIVQVCLNTDSTMKDLEKFLKWDDEIVELLDGDLTIESDTKTVKFRGRKLSNSLAGRILKTVKENGSLDSIGNFLNNLLENPSWRSVEELYGFLESCELPITSDGCFLAYKKIRYDYTDIKTGAMKNTLGVEVSMPRNEVEDDSSKTCAAGLHCAAFGYLSYYKSSDADDRVVIVKVNPADVVSIPADYNNQKMRVCKYTVIDELPNDKDTRLMKWTYGDRKIGWIRDTLASLKEDVKAAFGLDEVFTQTRFAAPRRYTDANIQSFLTSLSQKYKVQDLPSKVDDPRGITIADLLQLISNWAA